MINTNPTAPAWITHTDLIQIDGGHYITYPDDLALTQALRTDIATAQSINHLLDSLTTELADEEPIDEMITLINEGFATIGNWQAFLYNLRLRCIALHNLYTLQEVHPRPVRPLPHRRRHKAGPTQHRHRTSRQG